LKVWKEKRVEGKEGKERRGEEEGTISTFPLFGCFKN
jgi:hypothetical protein